MKKILITLLLIIFLSGCIKQQKGCTEEAKICPDGSVVVRVPPDCEFEACPSLSTTPKETTTIISMTTTTVKTSSKLLSWTKEDGVRIDSGVSSCTIIKDNEYWMYYTEKGIELAKSSDGLQFVKFGTVLDVKDVSDVDMVTNPAVFKTKDGKYRLIFEGSKRADGGQKDRRLYSAISTDGLTWMVEEGVRFQDIGDGKPGEIFTSVPDIIRLDDGKLRMYYTRGATSAIAISEDEGMTWTKEKNLDMKRIVIDPDVIRLDDGTYKLFFTSFDSEFGKGEQYMMSASSTDSINFVLDEGKCIRPISGYDMIVDPDIIKLPDGKYRMYYGESSKGTSFRINSALSSS
jgi:hypothetical protein